MTFELPPLDSSKKELKLPELENLKSREKQFKEHFEINDLRTVDEKYKEDEKMYLELFGMFKKKSPSQQEVELREKLKELAVENIEEFEVAIKTKRLDLKEIDVKVISKVLSSILKEKEDRLKPLCELGIKNIDEFHKLVNNGTIEIQRYKNKEIDDFIDLLLKKGVD